VEPKFRLLAKIPTEWATDHQKDNLFKSLQHWAREQRFVAVRISPCEKQILFGFKENETVLKVEFIRQTDYGTWLYSLTKEGLREPNSYPLGSAQSKEPGLILSWKDFEKGALSKSGEVLPKPGEEEKAGEKEKPGETKKPGEKE